FRDNHFESARALRLLGVMRKCELSMNPPSICFRRGKLPGICSFVTRPLKLLMQADLYFAARAKRKARATSSCEPPQNFVLRIGTGGCFLPCGEKWVALKTF